MRNIFSQPDYKKRDGWGSYFTLIPSHITSILAVNKNFPSTLLCNLLIENCNLRALITVSEKSSNKYWYLWRLMLLIIQLMPLCFLSHTRTDKSIKVIVKDRCRVFGGRDVLRDLNTDTVKILWTQKSDYIGLFLSLLLYRPKAFPKTTGNHLFFKVCTKLVF